MFIWGAIQKCLSSMLMVKLRKYKNLYHMMLCYLCYDFNLCCYNCYTFKKILQLLCIILFRKSFHYFLTFVILSRWKYRQEVLLLSFGIWNVMCAVEIIRTDSYYFGIMVFMGCGNDNLWFLYVFLDVSKNFGMICGIFNVRKI